LKQRNYSHKNGARATLCYVTQVIIYKLFRRLI